MICGRFFDRFGIPLGSQPIKFALARHSGVQVPVSQQPRVVMSLSSTKAPGQAMGAGVLRSAVGKTHDLNYTTSHFY